MAIDKGWHRFELKGKATADEPTRGPLKFNWLIATVNRLHYLWSHWLPMFPVSSPVFVVHARNAWDHDPPFGDENASSLWLGDARVMNISCLSSIYFFTELLRICSVHKQSEFFFNLPMSRFPVWIHICRPSRWETISKTSRQCRADQWKTMKTSKNASLQSMKQRKQKNEKSLTFITEWKIFKLKTKSKTILVHQFQDLSHHFKSSRSI